MYGVTCKVTMNKFPKVVARFIPAVGERVAEAAIMCQNGARRRARVDTGRMRNSIVAVQEGPTRWVVGTNVEYAIYHEYGTVHMAAQPMFHPAIDEVRAKIPGLYIRFDAELV